MDVVEEEGKASPAESVVQKVQLPVIEFDPFGGAGDEMDEVEKIKFLAENRLVMVEAGIDAILDSVQDAARRNAVIACTDSYGMSHCVWSSNSAVAWIRSIWDKNEDTYPYHEDHEEPVSFKF